MKTAIKILLLAVAVAAAGVSIFVFSGTRIMKDLDVSHIQIQDTEFVQDIKAHVAGIGLEWRQEFDEIDDLISVYYENRLIDDSQETDVKVALINNVTTKLTSYALGYYFNLSIWNSNTVRTIKENSAMLLN